MQSNPKPAVASTRRAKPMHAHAALSGNRVRPTGKDEHSPTVAAAGMPAAALSGECEQCDNRDLQIQTFCRYHPRKDGKHYRRSACGMGRVLCGAQLVSGRMAESSPRRRSVAPQKFDGSLGVSGALPVANTCPICRDSSALLRSIAGSSYVNSTYPIGRPSSRLPLWAKGDGRKPANLERAIVAKAVHDVTAVDSSG